MVSNANADLEQKPTKFNEVHQKEELGKIEPEQMITVFPFHLPRNPFGLTILSHKKSCFL